MSEEKTEELTGDNAELVKRLRQLEMWLRSHGTHEKVQAACEAADALSRQPLATPSVTAALREIVEDIDDTIDVEGPLPEDGRYNVSATLACDLVAKAKSALTSESTEREERARKAERYLIESGCPGNIPIADIILRHFGGEA